MAQMDQMTQQNAALVEEAAAATASLKELADNLALVVSEFKLERAHTTALAPVARLARNMPGKYLARPVLA